jgi:hypothetical protein
MILRATLALAALLALGSCATLTEEECRAGDWFQIGVNDGAEGRGTDHIEAHRRACARAGVSPDVESWLRGRERGLRLYCRPEKAYAVGRNGRSIAPGCTAAELERMRPAHDWGMRYYDIGVEIRAIEGDIRAIDAELVRLPPDATGTRARLLAERARLEARLGLLRAQQRRYASWPA